MWLHNAGGDPDSSALVQLVVVRLQGGSLRLVVLICDGCFASGLKDSYVRKCKRDEIVCTILVSLSV